MTKRYEPWAIKDRDEEHGVTDEDIAHLQAEAGEAGDIEQVRLCERALAGDRAAWAECERVILAAQAMGE